MAGRGGKRPGAGRKPSTLKGIVRRLPKESGELIFANINVNQKWIDLANSADERIVLETLKYLTDRAYGKAHQAIEESAGQGTEMQFVVRSILDKPDTPQSREFCVVLRCLAHGSVLDLSKGVACQLPRCSGRSKDYWLLVE